MAHKIVRMLKRYRGPDGRTYEKGMNYHVSRQVAESWYRTQRAELVEGQAPTVPHEVKAFARAPAHQAHDHPMVIGSNVEVKHSAKETGDDEVRSPHVSLPPFHIDQMNRAELLKWLDDNVDEHSYDKRYAVSTLRRAVKDAVKKNHLG